MRTPDSAQEVLEPGAILARIINRGAFHMKGDNTNHSSWVGPAASGKNNPKIV
jgi:hypothetical protein